VPIGVLANALEQACEANDVSSVHVTFCEEDEWHALGQAGWLRRMGMQFHWENQEYADFEDFLGALSSRKRKVLRRERRDANAAGLTFHALSARISRNGTGTRSFGFITRRSTGSGARPNLTRKFFSLLGERLGDRVVLMYAEKDGKPVAGALNLAGSEALFGRNWGCVGGLALFAF